MNNKTWSCEPIQTRRPLYELSGIKEDYYKTYIVTYQLVNLIKASVHLRKEFMGSGPLPFFQTDHLCENHFVLFI